MTQITSSFLDHVLEENTRLFQGLDQKSQDDAKNMLERALFIGILQRRLNRKSFFFGNSLGEIDHDTLRASLNKTKSSIKFKAPNDYYSPESAANVFGLSEMRQLYGQSLTDYLSGKDALDCGACHGDSAIYFAAHFPFKKVYAIDPFADNLAICQEHAEINQLSKRVVATQAILGFPEAAMLAANNNELPLAKVVAGTNFDYEFTNPQSRVINWQDQKNQQLATSIDKLCQEQEITPGLIKMDIEGSEYRAILAAQETIKQHLPILSIAIYHSAQDYYYIKPLLESYTDEYDFYVRNLNPLHPTYELFLLAVPKKLQQK